MASSVGREARGAGAGLQGGALAEDAAFGGVEEGEELGDLGDGGGFVGLEGCDLRGEIAVLPEEEGLVGLLEGADRLRGEAAALEADEVEAAEGGRVAVGDHEGRNVFRDLGEAADDGRGRRCGRTGGRPERPEMMTWSST